jgi:hypothetical protein
VNTPALMVTPILQSVVVVESDSADGCTEGNILGSTRGFAVDGVSSIRAIVRPAAFSSNQPFSFSMVTKANMFVLSPHRSPAM